MFYKLRNECRKKWFDFNCQDILSTPPLEPQGKDVVILSEVSNTDLVMYLVAVKSFFHFLKRGQIVLLLDDDCPEANVKVLKEHLNPLDIRLVQQIKSEHCPVGGTWERLLAIADLVEDRYVIQIDSDTVTSGEIPEVIHALNRNCSFTLSEWENQEIVAIDEACAAVAGNHNTHVQMLAEQNFSNLTGYPHYRYVRGQSSFCGFAKGAFSRERLEEFSSEMSQILGENKWREWGSESTASNFMIANSAAATMLPYPKYASYYPSREEDFAASVFVHFEGTNRLKKGLYIEKSKQVIDHLLCR